MQNPLPLCPCRAGSVRTATVSQKSPLPNKSVVMGVTRETESEWSSEMVTKARHSPRITTWLQVVILDEAGLIPSQEITPQVMTRVWYAAATPLQHRPRAKASVHNQLPREGRASIFCCQLFSMSPSILFLRWPCAQPNTQKVHGGKCTWGFHSFRTSEGRLWLTRNFSAKKKNRADRTHSVKL